MSDLTLHIMYFIYVLCTIVSGVVTLVLGILIVKQKKKNAGYLGAFFILSGIGGMFVFLQSITLKIMYTTFEAGVSSVTSIQNAFSYLSYFISLATVVVLFLYARKSYGSKGLIAIIITKLLFFPAYYIFYRLVIYRSLVYYIKNEISVAYSGNLINMLFLFVVALITFLAYFKNRHKEEMVPKFWIYTLIELIRSVIMSILYIYIISLDAEHYNDISALDDWTAIISYILTLAVPISAIYVYIRTKRYSKVTGSASAEVIDYE